MAWNMTSQHRHASAGLSVTLLSRQGPAEVPRHGEGFHQYQIIFVLYIILNYKYVLHEEHIG